MNRIKPQGSPGLYKTYQIASPLSTHFRPGTCEEAECAAYQYGWKSEIDESTTLGQMQAHYIRNDSGRKFTEERDEIGLTVFTFEAGQKCFAQHQVSLERPELYIVRGGDWRGNPRQTKPRRHQRPADWVEDFAEHQQKLSDAQQKG